MREIKFRVWNKQNNSMIPDDFIAIDLDGEISEIDMFDDCTWKGTARCKNKYILMQYTGLKDKNGTEIYEGDILEVMSFEGNKNICSVTFNDGCFSHVGYLGDLRTYPLRDFLFNGSKLEVIGNIYENPELLEGDNL